MSAAAVESSPASLSVVITASRPLISIEAATLILGSDTNFVEYNVDCGKLLAFDIAIKNDRRRCLRLYTVSVLALKTGVEFIITLDTRKLLSTIFPVSRPAFPAPRVAWLLHCDRAHIRNLATHRLIKETSARNQNNSRLIDTGSIIDFLAERRTA